MCLCFSGREQNLACGSEDLEDSSWLEDTRKESLVAMATVGKKGKGDAATPDNSQSSSPAGRTGTPARAAPSPAVDTKRGKKLSPASQPSAPSAKFSRLSPGGGTPTPTPGTTTGTTPTTTSSSSTTKTATTGIPKPHKSKTKERGVGAADVCCLKSSSTSSQNLKEQSTNSSPTQNQGSPIPSIVKNNNHASSTPKSPKSSIFSRLLHRQGHGGHQGGAHGNTINLSKGGRNNSPLSPKQDSPGGGGAGNKAMSPKSPKGRSSDGRLRIFNRSSSVKEVKIALPPTTIPSGGKANSQSRSSNIKQTAIRDKVASKAKETRHRVLKISGSLRKSAAEKVTGLSACSDVKSDVASAGNDVISKSDDIESRRMESESAHHNSADLVNNIEDSDMKQEEPKSRRDSVQAWVNSISDEGLDGVEEMEPGGAARGQPTVTISSEVGAGAGKADEDELTLGAEAKLLTPGKDMTLSQATKDRLAEIGASSMSRPSSDRRALFSSIRPESFNSEGSAHSVRTWDSIDQLLNERTGDPEEILTNLGFHSQDSEEALPTRVPERFLRQKSVAQGISVERFIESNPELREYVALTRSLSEPSTVALAKVLSPQTKDAAKSKRSSFANVVKTMTLVMRITSRMSWKEYSMTRHLLAPRQSATADHQTTPYTAMAPSGRRFASILHPDNSAHLAQQGVYDDLPEVKVPPVSKAKSRWKAIRRARMAGGGSTDDASPVVFKKPAPVSINISNECASAETGRTNLPMPNNKLEDSVIPGANEGERKISNDSSNTLTSTDLCRIPSRFSPCPSPTPRNVSFSFPADPVVTNPSDTDKRPENSGSPLPHFVVSVTETSEHTPVTIDQVNNNVLHRGTQNFANDEQIEQSSESQIRNLNEKNLMEHSAQVVSAAISKLDNEDGSLKRPRRKHGVVCAPLQQEQLLQELDLGRNDEPILHEEGLDEEEPEEQIAKRLKLSSHSLPANVSEFKPDTKEPSKTLRRLLSQAAVESVDSESSVDDVQEGADDAGYNVKETDIANFEDFYPDEELEEELQNLGSSAEEDVDIEESLEHHEHMEDVQEEGEGYDELMTAAENEEVEIGTAKLIPSDVKVLYAQGNGEDGDDEMESEHDMRNWTPDGSISPDDLSRRSSFRPELETGTEIDQKNLCKQSMPKSLGQGEDNEQDTVIPVVAAPVDNVSLQRRVSVASDVEDPTIQEPRILDEEPKRWRNGNINFHGLSMVEKRQCLSRQSSVHPQCNGHGETIMTESNTRYDHGNNEFGLTSPDTIEEPNINEYGIDTVSPPEMSSLTKDLVQEYGIDQGEQTIISPKVESKDISEPVVDIETYDALDDSVRNTLPVFNGEVQSLFVDGQTFSHSEFDSDEPKCENEPNLGSTQTKCKHENDNNSVLSIESMLCFSVESVNQNSDSTLNTITPDQEMSKESGLIINKCSESVEDASERKQTSQSLNVCEENKGAVGMGGIGEDGERVCGGELETDQNHDCIAVVDANHEDQHLISESVSSGSVSVSVIDTAPSIVEATHTYPDIFSPATESDNTPTISPGSHMLRFTQSERDDSMDISNHRWDRTDLEKEEETVEAVVEHLIDDNVLDRTLSEENYCHSLLEQLSQNREHLSIDADADQSRRSSEGFIGGRYFPAPETLHQQGRTWDYYSTNLCTLINDGESGGEEKKEDRLVNELWSEVEKVKGSSALRLTQQHTQPSFEIEEITTPEDMCSFEDSSPAHLGGKRQTGPMMRASSCQSDSSGFVDTESTDNLSPNIYLYRQSNSEGRAQTNTHTPPSSGLAPPEMGVASAKLLTPDNRAFDVTRAHSQKEDNLWHIVENGREISHHDFLFGVPRKPSVEKPRSEKMPTKPASGGVSVVTTELGKSEGMSEPRWVSRMYIDPPTSPKVSNSTKMEVCLFIQNGRIQDIHNARRVPASVTQGTQSDVMMSKRAVSYLHVCVMPENKLVKMTPVDMGSFMMPDYARFKPDVTDHKLLCSILKRPSFAWRPTQDDLEDQCSVWAVNGVERDRKQHLLEEVKLIQYAITKFKVEFRALDIRTSSIYNEDDTILTNEQMSELAELRDLRLQIMDEIVVLEQTLADRLRHLLGKDADRYLADLSSLNAIQQLVGILKEQVYHCSIANSLQPHSPTQLKVAPEETHITQQLTLLQTQISTTQSESVSHMDTAMDKLRESLLAEVRKTVQEETETLRQQVKVADEQVKEMREQFGSSRSSSSAQEEPMHLAHTQRPELSPLSTSPTIQHPPVDLM